MSRRDQLLHFHIVKQRPHSYFVDRPVARRYGFNWFNPLTYLWLAGLALYAVGHWILTGRLPRPAP